MQPQQVSTLDQLYSGALENIKKGEKEDGIFLLRDIIKNIEEMDQDGHNALKYKCLISLGEVLKQSQLQEALEYFSEAVEMLNNQVAILAIGKSKKEEEFNIIIKMIQIAQSSNQVQKQIILLKRALNISQPQYVKGLTSRFHLLCSKYDRDDDMMQINAEMNRRKLFQEEQEERQTQCGHEKKEEDMCLPVIKIKINLSQPYEQLQRYSLIEKMLAIAYILLKLKDKRSLSSKKIFVQADSKEMWQYLQRNVDLKITKIEYMFVQQKENVMDTLMEPDEAVRMGDFIRKCAEKMLWEKGQNEVKQYRKYEWHYRYSSLQQYFDQLFKFRQFQPKSLCFLQQLNPEAFRAVFPSAVKEETTMHEQQRGGYALIGDKLMSAPIFEQKDRRAESNILMNQLLREFFNINISEYCTSDSKIFRGSIEMAQNIVEIVVDYCCQQGEALLDNFNFRLMLSKVITLVARYQADAFQNIIGLGRDWFGIRKRGLLLEIVNIRLEQLCLKRSRSQEFAVHQKQKIQGLKMFVKKWIIGEVADCQNFEYMMQKGYLYLQQLRFCCFCGDDQKNIQFFRGKLMQIHDQIKEMNKETHSKIFQREIDVLVQQFEARSVNPERKREILNRQKKKMRDRINKSEQYARVQKYHHFCTQKAAKSNKISYLENVIKVFKTFFQIIQQGSIIVSEISLWAEHCKLNQIVVALFYNLSQDLKIKELTLLLYLIKLYLLQQLNEQSDILMRAILLIFSTIIQENEEQRARQAINFLLLSSKLVRYKHFERKNYQKIKEKFYSLIIAKNYDFLLDSDVYENEELEQADTRNKILQILKEIYLGAEIDVTKMEEAFGYLTFMYEYNKEEIKLQVFKIEEEQRRRLKKCANMIKEKRGQIHEYCQKFNETIKLFNLVIHGQAIPEAVINLQQELNSENQFCKCCNHLNLTKPIYYKSLVVLACYHVQYPFDHERERSQQFKLTHKYHMLDEKYLVELLLIRPKDKMLWSKLVATTYHKVCTYYDSIVGEEDEPQGDFQQLQPKIQQLKNIVKLVNQLLPYEQNLIKNCDLYIQMLDVLKIKERQYRMIMKDLEWAKMNTTRDSRDATRRYKEGLKRTLSQANNNIKRDPLIRTMRLLEFKMKLAWIGIEKEYRMEEKKDITFVEVDHQPIQEKAFKPSKLKEQITKIIAEAKEIITSLALDPNFQVLAPLQEDIVIQIYSFLFQSIEFKVQKIIDRLCEVIRVSSKTDQCRKLKEMQYTLNQLEYITQLFHKSDFLSKNRKYRFKEENEDERKKEEDDRRVQYQHIFQRVFDKDRADEPRTTLPMTYTKNKNHYNSDNQQVKQEDIWSHQIPEGPVEFNPRQIHLGKYFYNRLKQYMNQNPDAESRFNSIHSVIGSWSYYTLLSNLTKVMKELLRVFMRIGEDERSRVRNRRAMAVARWTSSMIIFRYSNNCDVAEELIGELFNPKNDEIVFGKMHSYAPESYIFPISDIYSRSMVRQTMKRVYIEYLFRFCQKTSNLNMMISLLNKLGKLSKGYAEYVVPEDLARGVNMEILPTVPFHQLQIKHDVQFYFFLLEEGSLHFIKILRKEFKVGYLPEKYEQFLTFIKVEIQQRIEEENSNEYYKSVKEYLSYENKKKKKRLKKEKDRIREQLQKDQRKNKKSKGKNIKVQKQVQVKKTSHKSKSKSKSKSQSKKRPKVSKGKQIKKSNKNSKKKGGKGKKKKVSQSQSQDSSSSSSESIKIQQISSD